MGSRIKFVCLLGLAVATSSPALPLRHINVQQLELLLADDHGQSDGKVADQISSWQLTERLSAPRLARLEAEFPGRRCHDALTQLADEAAFLDLPDADLLSTPPPDIKTQVDIANRAVAFVNQTFTRLPNFYATRTTAHFEDTPPRQSFTQGAPSPGIRSGRGGGTVSGGILTTNSQVSSYVPLHFTGKATDTISYHEGYELVNSKPVDVAGRSRSSFGLTTAGEFGPILDLVLGDAIKGKLSFSYWQQDPVSKSPAAPGLGLDPNGIQAVFRYSVPAGQSSYLVAIPTTNQQTIRVFPAYSGEIAIDPASGDILRITVVANLAPPYERMSTAILVEYGPVQIGGTTYICPVQGVAVSKTPLDYGTGVTDSVAPAQNQMNDVSITNYHLFRSESRIIPVEADNSTDQSPAQPADQPTAPPTAPAPK